MIDFFELLPFVVLLSVAGTSLYLIFGKRDKDPNEPTGKILQRLYFYLVSFVSLIMVGSGSTILIQFLLQEFLSENIMSSSPDQVALGTALVVVGAPLWILHWKILANQIKKSSRPISSQIRKIYKFLALAVSVSILAHSATGIIQFLLGTKESSWYQLAALIPFTLIWVFHWRIHDQKNSSSPPPIIGDIYIYLTSLIGLIMAANGLGTILHSLFESSYDSIAGVQTLLEPQNGTLSENVRNHLSIAITGILLWILHWLVLGNRKHPSRLKSAYVYACTIFGGGITFLVGILLLIIFFHGFLYNHVDKPVAPPSRAGTGTFLRGCCPQNRVVPVKNFWCSKEAAVDVVRKKKFSLTALVKFSLLQSDPLLSLI